MGSNCNEIHKMSKCLETLRRNNLSIQYNITSIADKITNSLEEIKCSKVSLEEVQTYMKNHPKYTCFEHILRAIIKDIRSIQLEKASKKCNIYISYGRKKLITLKITPNKMYVIIPLSVTNQKKLKNIEYFHKPPNVEIAVTDENKYIIGTII